MNTTCSPLATITVFISVSAALHGQPTANQIVVPQAGIQPYGTYSVSKIDSVDPVSGNVKIDIPLTSTAPGPGGFSIPISLVYNSSIYGWVDNGFITQIWPFTDPFNAGGWHYSIDYMITEDGIGPLSDGPCSPQIPTTTYSRYRLLTPDGASHTLYISGRDDDSIGGYYPIPNYYSGCYPGGSSNLTGNMTFYTADGSYLRIAYDSTTQAWTVYAKDGTIVKGTGWNVRATDIYDRNSNHISITSVASGLVTTITIKDDLNRLVTIQQTITDDASGFLASETDTITQNGYAGQSLLWQVNYSPIGLDASHAYECGDSGHVSCNIPGSLMVSSIILPNSLQFGFVYGTGDSPKQWGQLSTMTLPSGATVDYTYVTEPLYGSPFIFPVTSRTVTWRDENAAACNPGPCPVRIEPTVYSTGHTSSTVTNPDGSIVTYSFHDSYGTDPSPFTGLVYRISTAVSATGAILETVDRVWAANVPWGKSSGFGGGPWPVAHMPGNPYLQSEIRSMGTGSGSVPVLATSYSVDRNGNPLSVAEYDCTVPQSPCSVTGFPASGFSGGTLSRATSHDYVNGAGPAIGSNQTQGAYLQGSTSQDTRGYWNVLTPQLLELPCLITTPLSITQYLYDGESAVDSCPRSTTAIARGNVVQERHWDSGNGVFQTTVYGYDAQGDVTSIKNPRNYTTTFTYDSHFYVSDKHIAIEDTANTRWFTYEHDFDTGVLTLQKDNDHLDSGQHKITTSYDYDQLARLRSVNENSVRAKFFAYEDSLRTITEYTDRNCFGDSDPNGPMSCAGLPPGTPTGAFVKTTWYDQLGRLRQTKDWAGNYAQVSSQIATPSSCSDTTKAEYQLSSNPYATQTETTMGWTRTRLDALGRPVEVKHYTGVGLPPPWGSNCVSTGGTTYLYNGNATTFHDEAYTSGTNFSWTRETDGLGRLTKVTESGIGASTTYGYDALDDLLSVTPATGDGRSFTYTSLKQLQTATNPESGTISYTYDANGNLLTRTDDRNITTTYCLNGDPNTCYDGLDELLGKTYSDYGSSIPTPWVNYSYNKGWLTQVGSGSSSYSYTAWDGIGRVTSAKQTTNGRDYPFTITHMPFTGIRTIQYPNSGRTITTSYDAGGRAAGISGQVLTSTPTPYVSSTAFQADGAVSARTFGNGLILNRTDNARLQPAEIKLGTSLVGNVLRLGYCYSASDCPTTTSLQTGNNGNILQETIERAQVAGSWTQNFTYDGINRLKSATETGTGGWLENFDYSLTGNRWISGTPMGLPALTVEVPQSSSWYQTNNRIDGWSYDDAGNLTGIPASAGSTARVPCTSGLPGGGMLRSACYDAENRMVSVTDSNGSTSTYVYDGDGHRVERWTPSGTTVFVYDPMGNLAQEFGVRSGVTGTSYVFDDALGSTRLVTDGQGAPLKCYDYLPFGEEIGAGTGGRSASCFGNAGYPGSPDILSQKFTSKERDAESGLDFFGARYFSGAQGRWTSPDRMNVTDDKLLIPSTLNKYVYAGNNPLRFIDPDGRDVVALLEPPHGMLPGHFMLFANNPATGESGMMSFGPSDTSALGHLETALDFSVRSTNSFALPMTADELRSGYAALSIQTTPEQAQDVLNYIKSVSASTGSTPYQVLSTNCTTVCRDALKATGILPRNAGSIAPISLWTTLYQKYGNQSLITHPEVPARYGETRLGPARIPSQQGTDYGGSRFGMNTFDYIMLMLQPTQVTSKVCYPTDDGKQVCQ